MDNSSSIGVGNSRSGGGTSSASVSSIESDNPPRHNSPGVARGRSKVWGEFYVSGDGTKVTCKRCGDALSYTNSHSTSSMLKHLKRKHQLDMFPSGEEADGTARNKPKETPTKKPKKSKAKKPSGSGMLGDMPPLPASEEDLKPSIQHDPLVFMDPCVRMRWADHSDTVLKTFSIMYNDESYTDCILVAEKQFFRGHRVLLSSASELLAEMFQMTPAVHQPIIFLNNVKAMELRILLDFIYKGEVAIPPSLIPGLVKIGSELKVKGLSDFVWNDQLASTLFPQGGYSNVIPTTSQPQMTGMNNVSPKQYTTEPSMSKPLESLHQTTFTINPSMTYTAVKTTACNMATSISKTYSKQLQPNRHGSPQHLNTSHNTSDPLDDNVLGCGEPQVKRIKILSDSGGSDSGSPMCTSSSPFLSAMDSKKNGSQVSDTVLMVTNQGETVLSTSQGGVTLMTPNSMSLPVSFTIKDDGSMPSHSHGHFVSGQPVAILSSCGPDGTQGLEEVVYSIAEVPDGEHEVLMSAMDQSAPIVVYDSTLDSDSNEKKLFTDDLSHKT